MAFSGYTWVNELYALAGAGASILLGVLFTGQAKTLEALTILTARLKSRFALEGLSGSAALGEKTSGRPPIIPQRKERVVRISDEDARQSGLRTK